jgi:rRNA biogenesis protein RRP5
LLRRTLNDLRSVSIAMAPVKRKGNDPDESNPASKKQRVKATDSKKGAPKKERKPDGASKKKPETKPNPVPESTTKTAVVSVLRDEAPAFPRGGASLLTPLEKKQIHIQATRDVLFEQHGGGEADGLASGDDEGADYKDTAKATTPKSKRKRKDKGKTANEQSEKPGVRVEPLNFKVLIAIPCALLRWTLLIRIIEACFRVTNSRSSGCYRFPRCHNCSTE